MPAPDLALLTAAAREAGEIALGYWRRSPAAWEKEDGGGGPVSEADLAVNGMLAERLRNARPDYGWLSEESVDGAERLSRERVFIVDPIDGTRAFLAGEAGFAHALAVAERGRITAAVVHMPALGLTFSATGDGPALLNGAVLPRLPETVTEMPTILANAAAFAAENWPGGKPPFHRGYRPSLAHRLCLVAQGRFEGSLVLRDTFEWDVAAGALIAERAGAAVSDRFGRPLSFNAPRPVSAGVIAAVPAVHAALIGGLGRGGEPALPPQLRP